MGQHKTLYIVVIDEMSHCFATYDEFCNFMSENSHRCITKIEKSED